MKKHLFFTAMLAACFFTGTAQNFDTAKMDSLFSLVHENDKAFGSFALLQDGKEIYTASFGFADVDNKTRITEKTRFRIGSISKSFTAAMIMQLVDEGKLSLDTKLAQFFPEMPNASEITVKHLLKHQSGLMNFTNAEDYLQWNTEMRSRDELLELFKSNGSVFQPGERTEYSNTNYVLLSFILEDLEKQKYPEILEKRILDPLGLKDTYYGGPIDAGKGEAYSYKKVAGWELQSETSSSIPIGAGGIVSTASDLNRFYSALLNGKVVSEASLEEMKIMESGMGIGLFKFPFQDKFAFGHTGGIDGFAAIAGYFPEEKLGMALTTSGTSIDLNELLIGALSIYFGMEYSLPEYAPTVEVSEEDLQPLVGVYGNDTFPLKITISNQGNALFAQATGQQAFPLAPSSKTKFSFDRAKITMEFLPQEKIMIFSQGPIRQELKME